MRIKRTIPVMFISACLIILVAVDLFEIPSIASGRNEMSIIHESADILHYEDGAPYIHDVLTNNTDKIIIETQYTMLAYDANGSPLKLYWNFLDSSFENVVSSKENILPGQTEQYRGGWSLYDGKVMKDFPKVGDGGASQAAYSRE